MKKGSWKKLKSKIVHKNPWYSIREDDVILPNGKKGKYFVLSDVNSVAIIAEDKDKKIYLVGQSRYPTGNNYSWEIITGGYRGKEKPLDAAKRELKEEAGIKANKWTSLGYCYPINGYSPEKTSIYLAQNLIKTNANYDESEDITVTRKSLKEILKMIKNNKIACGLTVFAITKYLIYKDKINL